MEIPQPTTPPSPPEERESMTWALALVTAAATGDDGAVEALVSAKLDEGIVALIKSLIGTAHAGAMYARMGAEFRGMSLDLYLVEVGKAAAVWEFDT